MFTLQRFSRISSISACSGRKRHTAGEVLPEWRKGASRGAIQDPCCEGGWSYNGGSRRPGWREGRNFVFLGALCRFAFFEMSSYIFIIQVGGYEGYSVAPNFRRILERSNMYHV